jgi:hypothetical protein
VDQFDLARFSDKSFNEICGRGILVYDNPQLPASVSGATGLTLMVERIDIERALDKIASDEGGFRFQSLAVVLAKLRWPELFASERHNDRGLDAYAPISVSPDGRGKGLACSTTGTLDKVRSDAEKVQKHYPDVSLLVFYTTQKVTQSMKTEWAQKIHEKYGYELVVASREEIIASLQLPDNAQLCRTHLDIQVPYQPTITELLEQAREAAAAVYAAWAAHPRLAGKPHIILNAAALGRSGEDTVRVVNTASLRTLLQQGRRIVLEGPAGRGKTTTLIHLAGANERPRGIPILIDLVNWVRSSKDILDYVASSPPFRARGINAEDLARLSQAEPFLFLLNGWNEISEFYSSAAVDALRGLERAFPTAGIIVATRTHHIVPPLPGADRFRLLPVTPGQRFRYLAQALGDGPARELNLTLSRDPELHELTRTPFVLSEVTSLFRAGLQIPKTKLGFLRAVVGLMERSEEHAGELQAPPLRGLAEHYLRALAIHLTGRGDVLLDEPDARSVCRRVSEALRDAGQINVAPEPDEILITLTSHHILERVEYPAVSFRFEHQQFQEYYSALKLQDELRKMVASGDSSQADLFARNYINDPSWEEPLLMIAADLGDSENAIAAGKALVKLALRVDAVFAARLSYMGGPSVWKEIRGEVRDRLKVLYAAPNHQLREYALAAMLATGSDEFADIVIPLLTNADQQVRRGTYRSGMPFHPSSLGPDWRGTVAGWREEQRAEFASELTMLQGIIEVGLIFARSDPSLAVRLVALQGLSWMGQHDAVSEILQSLSDAEFEQAIQKFHRQEIPLPLHQRAISAYKTLLVKTTDLKARLRIALALAELNDADTPARLKAELNALPPDLVRELSDYTLRPAVEILRAADPQWLSEWVQDRVIKGELWRDSWVTLILEIPHSTKEQLLHRACTEDLRRSGGGGAIALLRATADADTAKAVFVAFRDHHRALLTDLQNQEKQAIDSQLQDLLRSIPRPILIDGLSGILAQPPENEDLGTITELFALRGADNKDANEVLPELQRNQLRSYLKSAVRFMLAQDDFSGQGKGYLSSALARVGEVSDMADVVAMIRADIIRMREGRAARARDHRTPRAQGSSMCWTTWHVEALVRLGRVESEAILLVLLNEPEYEVDAAWALQVIARKTQPGPSAIMGARFGQIPRDFRRVRSGASEWHTFFVEDLRVKYVTAIKQRILNLLEESKTGDHNAIAYHHRLKELAKILATLDPRDSADLIIGIAELPSRFDGWIRLALLEALVFAGIALPERRVAAILEPVLAAFRTHGIYNTDAGLLMRLLSVLPFVDDPKRGIARIRELLTEFRVSWYHNRDLLFALAQCIDDSGLTLLGDIGGLNENVFQYIAKDWLEAVASCPLPGARAIILGFVDPETHPCVSPRALPDYAVDSLAGHLADLARGDSYVAGRFVELTTWPVSAQQRAILEKVLARMGSRESLLAGLNLIDDSSPQPIPYEIFTALEDVFLEKRPHAGNAQWYTLVPRAANDLKTRLFEIAQHDPWRAKSAYGLLAQIEMWRLEYGRPPSEPRHPVFESGEMWPPIEPAHHNSIGSKALSKNASLGLDKAS